MTAFAIPKNDNSIAPAKYSERPVLTYDKREWYMPLAFMLMMSLTGLSFYPALLGVIAVMVHQWRHDRYNFIIMLMIFFGGFSLINIKMLPLKTTDMSLIISVILLFIYRKTKPIKWTVAVIGLYAAALIILASFSLESMSVQFITIRNYLSFVFFIVPLACFAGKEFDINRFFRKAIMFTIIMCAYYIIDAWILDGNVFAPYSYDWSEQYSTFYNLRMHPLSMRFERKMPGGLYMTMFAIYPICRCYKLRWWQWAIIAGGFMAAKTFILITGFVLAFVFFQGKIMTLIKYCALGIGAFVALYFIDGMLPRVDRGNVYESTLRIKSSVDQIVSLTEAADEEDIAEFASGRMAQIIPKVELQFKENKQWTGLGFLHPQYTKITRYMIYNEYYEDVAKREELAFGVENEPAHVFITIGFIGLAIHILFFVALWFIVRRMKYQAYYLCTLFVCAWGGMSGLTNLNSENGLLTLAMSFACVLLAQGAHLRKKKRTHPALI